MKLRAAGLGFAAILGAMLLVCMGLSAFGFGDAQENGPRRIAFQIATGSTGGTYFPVGELIAGNVSHPPGVARCEVDGACGPEGLIASARTSDGAVANALAVNSGQMDPGLAQSDVVADGVGGRGCIPQSRQANAFARDRSTVSRRCADRGRTVRAYRKRRRFARQARVAGRGEFRHHRHRARGAGGLAHVVNAISKVHHLSPDAAAQMLEKGKLDAFFFVGGAPVPLVQALTADEDRETHSYRWRCARAFAESRAEPQRRCTIAANTYPQMPKPLETVHGRALFIVRDSVPDALVYGIARALFAPVNRDQLMENRSAALIRIDTATQNLPAPLHPGAARFFRERGVLR